MRLFTLLISLVLFAGTSTADYSGTWVANIEKSQLGTPPPKSYVMHVEKKGTSTFLVTIDKVDADGKESQEEFTRTYDGQEHADDKEHPEATETCTQVDPLTRHIVGKNNGKVVYVTDAKMTPDRRSMTTHETLFAPDGQIREVLVFVFDRR
jgi:hypothetical protein